MPTSSDLQLYPWYLACFFGLKWLQTTKTTLKLVTPQASASVDEDRSLDGAANENIANVPQQLINDIETIIAHELRTPLTSIRALSEILRDNPDLEADQIYRFLEIMVQESKNLSDHIEQTLHLLEAERQKSTMMQDKG